jgi:Holliday junction resolvase-like predicted endonuclease
MLTRYLLRKQKKLWKKTKKKYNNKNNAFNVKECDFMIVIVTSSKKQKYEILYTLIKRQFIVFTD